MSADAQTLKPSKTQSRAQLGRRRSRVLLLAIPQVLIILVFFGPIFLAAITSLRKNVDIFRYGETLSWHTFVPFPIEWSNYARAFELPNYTAQLVNSMVLGLTQSTATVVLALLAAFALARLRFKGREIIFYLILATVFLPFEALAVPLFLVVKDLGQLNSFWGLFLPWVAAPIAIFTLRQAISDIPPSLDEAVMLDGGRLWHILRHVVIPNVWPAMITVWLITFIYVWDSFLWPLIVMQSPSKQLAQVGIVSLINPNQIDYGTLFAASIIATAPVVILFLLLQRYYREGSAASGIK